MPQTDVSVSWFEIPAVDVDRAVAFYEAVFETRLGSMQGPTGEIRTFPNGRQPSGCVLRSERNRPAAEGPLLFLGVGKASLQAVAARVEPAGGKLVVPPMSIGEHGFMAQLVDTEGNRVALHGTRE